MLCSGGAYVVKNPFTGRRLLRAAEKINPFLGDDQWLVKAQDTSFSADVEA